ncbi:MAG TPA: STAS domain-containing protein [Gemmatimonadales bacterium]|nr:STAS domain-containing protein [Gemmatimonadales bacterium]
MSRNKPLVAQVGGQVVVSLIGEIDLTVKSEVLASFEDAIGLMRVPHLLVVVSGVTFMDSSGLGALAAAVNRVQALGGTLSVVGASARLWRLFRIVQLDRLLTPLPSDAWRRADGSTCWASPSALPTHRATQPES